MDRYFFNIALSNEHADQTGEVIASESEAIAKGAQLLSELASDRDLMIEAGGEISIVVRRAEEHLITLTAARDSCDCTLKPE